MIEIREMNGRIYVVWDEEGPWNLARHESFSVTSDALAKIDELLAAKKFGDLDKEFAAEWVRNHRPSGQAPA